MPLFIQAHGPPTRRRALGVLLGAALALAAFAGSTAAPGGIAHADASPPETRSAFIVDLAEALCLQPDDTAAQKYSDLAPGDPDYGYIMAATDLGWVWGFPDGTFQPGAGLTREQMAKIEIIALGLQPQAAKLANRRPPYTDWDTIGHWAWGDVNEATAMGLLKGFTDQTFGPASTFTATEAQDVIAQLAAYLLKAPTVTAVDPSRGQDGTEVTVSGTGFCHATGVSFGGTAATSYDVKSVSDLTAVAPPGSGTVDVTVTTGKGTSPTSAADQFTYVVYPSGPRDVTLTGAHYDSTDGDFTLQFSGDVTASALQGADFVLSDAQDTLGDLGTVSGSGTSTLTTPMSGDQILTLGDEIQLASNQSDLAGVGADLVQTPPVPITGIPALTSADAVEIPESLSLPYGALALYLGFTEPVQALATLSSDLQVPSGDSAGPSSAISGSGTDTLVLTLESYSLAPGDSVAMAAYQHDVVDGAGMAVQPTAPVPIDFATLADASYDAGSHQLTLDFNGNVTASALTASDFDLSPAGDSLGTVQSLSGSGTQTLTLTLSGESLSGADTIDLAPGQVDIVDQTAGVPVASTSPVDVMGFDTFVTAAAYSTSTGVLTVTFNSWVRPFTVSGSDFTMPTANVGDSLGTGTLSLPGDWVTQIALPLEGASITSGDTLQVASGQSDIPDSNFDSLQPTTPVPIQIDP